MKSLLLAASAIVAFAGTAALAGTPEDYSDFEQMEYVPFTASDANAFAALPSVSSPTGFYRQGFEGISQYDVASVARNFIPPDTMGAVGTTQFMTFVNGGVAVYNKATGVRQSFTSDLAFWQGLGRAGANGDSRVLFDAGSQRWVALSFANNVAQIQIAVSNTADALGPWKSTVFTGYAGLGFGATADYPTMAITKNSLIIGTNDFAPSSLNGPNSFRGTGLTIIPINSIINATAPTVAGGVQYFTACCAADSDFTRGFAIQGVNGSGAGGVDHILAVSIEGNALTRYDVSNLNPNSALGAVRGTSTDFLGGEYGGNDLGRQPSALNPRVIDTLDDRVGASVVEVNGLIYSVHTITPLNAAGDPTGYTSVRWDVIRASDNVVVDEGQIKDNVHDFFEGSIAVNANGQVVIAYNRSGSGEDGRVTFAARSYNTNAAGQLVLRNGETILRVSDTSDYHNGSIDGGVAAGRQRWGDYSAVTLDPNDPLSFWAIGEFAREPNNAANGHPGGTGGTRWSTWIAELNVGTTVPEPATWAMMILGFGVVGARARRRRTGYMTA